MSRRPVASYYTWSMLGHEMKEQQQVTMLPKRSNLLDQVRIELKCITYNKSLIELFIFLFSTYKHMIYVKLTFSSNRKILWVSKRYIKA